MSVGVVDASATEAAAAEETVANPFWDVNVRGDFRFSKIEPPSFSFGDDATFGAPEGVCPYRGDAVVFESSNRRIDDDDARATRRARED